MMSNEQIMFDSIRCLYNGQYGEHSFEDIKVTKKQIYQMLKVQEDAYRKYIGKKFGDYLCENIEYDWGRHKQVWTVRCELCGATAIKENGYQWSRGKTGSMLCNCRAERKKEKIRAEKQVREEEKKKIEKEIMDEIGKTYDNFKVISCDGFGIGKCVVKCVNCGAERKSYGINQLRKGILPHCNCEKANYSDPKWIGTRNVHCVFTGMEGVYARLKCDCGRERLVNPSLFFKSHMYLDCGSPDCEYASDIAKKQRKKLKKGYDFETETENLLFNNGYMTERIGKTGDFGVDIIARRNDGLLIAIQCKCNHNSNVGVGTIQEVYAGGRYYGLSHFAVVAFGNVTAQAIKMAKKLGIYISDGNSFDYPDDIKKYAEELIPTIKVQKNDKVRKLYELNGEKKTLKDWAYLYNANVDNVRKGLKRGLTLEMALLYKPSKKQQYEVKGVSGSIDQLCNHFGIVTAQAARYRINRGMSIEEAVLAPQQSGRSIKTKTAY